MVRVDRNDDLDLVDHGLQHAELAVGLEPGEHAACVVVVEELASELEVELAPELVDAAPDVLCLKCDVLVVVESLAHMIETFRFPQPLHTHEPNHYIGWSRRPSRGLALRIEDSKMRRGGVRRAGTHDRERGSRQSGTGRTLMPLGLPGTGRLSSGVMEGARRRERGREALMLQSMLFYVLAIGGFREFPLQDEGCGLSSG